MDAATVLSGASYAGSQLLAQVAFAGVLRLFIAFLPVHNKYNLLTRTY